MTRSFASAFTNLSITAKLCLTPGLIAVLVLVMALVNRQSSIQQAEALSELADVQYAENEAQHRASQAVAAAHINLFRAISWLANSKDASKSESYTKDAVAQLELARKTIATLVKAEAAADDEAAATKAILDLLNAYGEAAKSVADMASADAATALLFMADAEDKYVKLNEAFTALAKAQEHHTNTMVAGAHAGSMAADRLAIVLLIGTLLIAGLASVLIARLIAGPVRTMTDVMGKLAGGDTAVDVPATEQREEVGAMARAVLVFKDNMIAAGEADARAAEDREVRARRAEQVERLTRNFDAEVSANLKIVAQAAAGLETTAQAMQRAAEQASSQSIGVAGAAAQASANVQTVAAAAEELSMSISEIGNRVAQSSTVAEKARIEAEGTNKAMGALAESVRKIGDVAQLISQIASQTNLLALNATIEAARAGEAGKGFAVVASEVKSLANQTAKATEEISGQIATIDGATRGSVEAIRSIGSTIANINEVSTAVAAAVEQQNAATQEIARNVSQAAAGTSQVTHTIGSVKDAAQETGAAASQVLTAAAELTRQSDSMRGRIEAFLAAVKAA